MKLKLTCSLFLFTLSLYVIAQSGYRPGYIIKNNSDTVFGKISYQNDISLGIKCKFKNVSDSVYVFDPDQIMAYRFLDSRYFVSKTYKQDKVFLECLINGIIKVYYLRGVDRDSHFFIEKSTMPLTELSYSKMIKENDGKQYISETKGYVKQLDYFMQDAEGILPRIEAISKPEQRELIELAEYYHNQVCKDTSCIIYEKPEPFLKVSVEPFFSMGEFNHIEGAYLSYGGYIIFHPSYEKLYIRTGFFHYEFYDNNNEIWYEGGHIAINQIPFQIELIKGNGHFKTRFGIGYDFMMLTLKDKKNPKDKFTIASIASPSLHFGILNKMTNSTDLSMGLNIQTTPIFYKLFNHFEILLISVDLGLRFNL
jgi:hypothetical protein